MSETITLNQLKSHLWASANLLRGKIDSSDFKHYIFGLLFYKRLSDTFDEEKEKVIKYYTDNGKSLILRITDRGPFVKGRILDCSMGAAKKLGFHTKGIANVKIEILELGDNEYMHHD